MRHIAQCPLLCDSCTKMHWITDKEYLYSQVDHQPIILECHIDGERIVRGTCACEQHPQYASLRKTHKKQSI